MPQKNSFFCYLGSRCMVSCDFASFYQACFWKVHPTSFQDVWMSSKAQPWTPKLVDWHDEQLEPRIIIFLRNRNESLLSRSKIILHHGSSFTRRVDFFVNQTRFRPKRNYKIRKPSGSHKRRSAQSFDPLHSISGSCSAAKASWSWIGGWWEGWRFACLALHPAPNWNRLTQSHWESHTSGSLNQILWGPFSYIQFYSDSVNWPPTHWVSLDLT